MATTTSSLSGFFYEIYAPELISLVPKSDKLLGMVGFESSERLGNKYHQPVIVQEEQGFTYAAAGAGAFSINSAISMATQDAQLDGSQILLSSTMDYETAAKAETSKQAFAKATNLQVKNMLDSGRKRLEVGMWYGTSATGLGETSGTTNADSSTQETITLKTGSYAPLIWGGSKGAQLVFYTGTTLVSSAADSIFSVKTVDIANRKITVTGTSTGCTALHTAAGSTGTYPYYYTSASGGTYASNEMTGVDLIVTASGTLFNIVNTTYDLFAGNSYSAASAPLSLGKIEKAAALGVNRGLDEDVTCFVHPSTFSDLITDQAAARRYPNSGSEAENGFETIKFHYSGGIVTVMPHGVVKEGEAFILPVKRFKRIGAQDISFKRPGRSEGDDIFIDLATTAGFEYRLYSHQALFCEAPAKCIKITSITNNT